LIRDAAYEAIPKKLRATLHQRFAEWLEAKAGDRVPEYDEILGYHLEQAYRYREELGPVGPADRGLALRAAERLGAAGRRALARRDAGAAVTLLLRAAELRPRNDSTRLELMESAGHLLVDAGHIERGGSIFARALEEAIAADSRPLAARIEMYYAWTRLLLDPRHGIAAVLEVGDRLEPALLEAEDDLSLARLHDMRAYMYDLRRRSADVEREAEIGIAHARRAGKRWHEVELHWWLLWELPQGPEPVESAIRRCHELRAQLHDDRAAEAVFLESLAELEAMRGRFEEARALIAASVAIRNELGLHLLQSKMLPRLGLIELLAGEPHAAESVLRRAYDHAEQCGDAETAANSASLLVEALLAQNRLVDAEALLPAAAQAAIGDAVAPHVRWRCAHARVLSRKAEHSSATAIAREAVELTNGTDDLNLQAAARTALAEALGAAGSDDEAVLAAEDALRLYEEKGNLVSAEATRTFLAGLLGPQPRN
jgi:hypothetical protein